MSLYILLPVLAILVLFANLGRLKALTLPLAIVGLVAATALAALGFGLNHPILKGMAEFDGYATAFSLLLIVMTGLSVLLLATPSGSTDIPRSEMAGLLILSLTGGVMLASYTNLVMLFLGIEILSIPVYVLAGARKGDAAGNEAALKYFLNGAFATGILLFGIGLIYAGTGQFSLDGILQWSQANQGSNHPLFLLGLLFLLFGLAFKVSAAPFHFWTPDVYEGAPSVVTAYMSTVVKIAAIAAFFRLLGRAFPAASERWGWILVLLAVLTLLIGNLGALAQGGFKRLMAYSGISHAGYLLIALLAKGSMAAGALWIYAAAYAAATMIAFAIWARFEEAGEGDRIEAFAGLRSRSPFLAVALGVAMLSLVGVPPLGGFFGKLFVFGNAVGQGRIALVVFAVVMSALGVAYYMRPVIQAWFHEGAVKTVLPLRAAEVTVLTICMVALFALAATPGLLLGAF
ncbi:MAG TPA: NADH-quinone oxidoreductase subunit N [Rectinemataceae bacterium]|nr:NADH-quinone oxidoreductase subunit N [Rectinemataceae bacterium]